MLNLFFRFAVQCLREGSRSKSKRKNHPKGIQQGLARGRGES